MVDHSPRMKIFTNNTFEGFYVACTAAVVVAENAWDAARILNAALDASGLNGTVESSQMVELDVNKEHAVLLCDGSL